jgi:hypothetical protein
MKGDGKKRPEGREAKRSATATISRTNATERRSKESTAVKSGASLSARGKRPVNTLNAASKGTASPAVLRVETPAAFRHLYCPIRYKVYYGGRGGAKSWAFAQALLVQGMQRPLF